MQRAETERLAIAHAEVARAHAGADGRVCSCGGGMWVAARCAPGHTWAAACDARDARAAWGMRARAEAAWGVGPLASVLCPAGTARLRRLVVYSFAFSTRPPAGVKRQPGTLPNRQATQPPDRPQGGPWANSQSPSHPKGQGGWGRNGPNCAPMPTRLHTITSRYRHAPPARAARSCRPLAPPARAARSRRPLAPSAHAAARLHWHRTLMVSLDLPIPPHLHTTTSRHPLAPPACAARLRRPLAPPARVARSRRPLAPPACVRHAVLMALRRFGDARDVGTAGR